MSAEINASDLTAGLEPALRYLSAHDGMKVALVAAKFKVKPEDMWAWLRQFNRGKPLLSSHIIDGVKMGLQKVEPKVRPDIGRVRTAAARVIGKDSARNRSEEVQPVEKITGPIGDFAQLAAWLLAQSAIGKTVVSHQVSVTPQMALRWLTLNQGNRNPSKSKIRRFAAAIKAERWTLNGETIKFSITGRLLDGQSRLRAIVEAGQPVQLEIRGGLPDAAQQTMDVGEARKGAHMLEMLGEQNPNIMAPALRLLDQWSRASLGYKGGTAGDKKVSLVLENCEIAPLLEKHSGIRASVGWCVSKGYKVAQLMPPSETAFFHYLFGLASAKKRDEFFDAVASGLGLVATSPAYHLRERLQADRAAQHRMGKRERYALVIKAWNAHFAGQKIERLVFRNIGDNRETFPVIAGVKRDEVEKAKAP